MKARTVLGRIGLVLCATLLLALSGTLAWAAVNDYQVRGLVPKGVTIVGKDLSGMTEQQARATIESAVSTPMMRPVTITGDGHTWSYDPQGTVSVDVTTMLNQAYSTRRSATFVTRLASELRGDPLPFDIKPVYSVDTTAISSWVGQTATTIDRKPINATRTLAPKYKFKITPEVYGAKVDQAASVQQIAGALTADAALAGSDRVVALTIATKKPKVLKSSFKNGIIVSLDQTKIFLYYGDKLVKTYMCAPGQPSWPTPKGDFKIVDKLADSPWYNPHSAWSASMPEVIPGGPDNPMGDRKIAIDYPGVFFHGVPPGEYGSIGSHASHECMRMLPSAVHDLYKRVNIGDPVYIRD